MVTTPKGIAIHRILNQPNNPQVLVADFSNSGLVKVRFFTPLITSWNSSPCGSYDHPSDIKTQWLTRNIFVADTKNHRIVKVKPRIGYPQTWDCDPWGTFGSGEGQFNEPIALAIENKSGDLYVSDKGNNRIQKLNDRGDFISEFNNLSPWGMAVDLDNNLYVSTLHNVFKFTPDFTKIPEWNPPVNSFSFPIGIAVDLNNDVYVVDSKTQQVKKFTKDGKHLLSWGGPGTGDGIFKYPYGITYDFNIRRIFVSDNRQHTIQVFEEDGSFVGKVII
jgi:DNA-binding beta-propeller fold protein YncE